MSEEFSAEESVLPSAVGDWERVDALNSTATQLIHQDAVLALTKAEEAYQLARLRNYISGMAYSLRNIGICHWHLSNYDKSLKALKEALMLFRQLEDYEGSVSVLYNLSTVYRLLGDYPQALECAFESLKQSQDIKQEYSEALSLAAIGAVYFLLEEYALALQYYQESLVLRERLRDKVGEGQMYASIGCVYGKLGENEKALECFEKSLSIAKQVGDQIGEAIALQNKGEVYGQMGDYQKALEMLSQSLSIKEALQNKAGIAETLILIGKIYAARQQHEQAAGSLYRALNLAEHINCKSQIVMAHYALAMAHKYKGDFKTALQHYEQFHLVERSVMSEENQRRLRSLQVQYELEKKQREAEEYRRKTIELAEINAMLRKQAEQLLLQATTDGLTGVYNRRYFNEALQREFERARRYGSVLSLAIADIDFFKQINDSYSHQIGDEVLKIVGLILRQSSRISDVVARYGGEEFALIFPETPVRNAAVACEKIRAAVEAYHWQSLDPSLKVTMSFGVADSIAKETTEHLLLAADAKLYEAKTMGRNCVMY
ncbi:MAG: diguanylate cyclase [Chloroherpetonaceae bacterium]|nr:diguanylate cyclase [Chloroherpetonaceae bacterium]MCS7210631.1 diguanylate cyclase [Chloroherpetonaceae bacterium]MDW8019917.1 diguanylate cyclase [Chloroherpetonaceae bacterium]MDW8466598.1 diguanylate cyclase [Chloroherpetonaceae bacterium]